MTTPSKHAARLRAQKVGATLDQSLESGAAALEALPALEALIAQKDAALRFSLEQWNERRLERANPTDHAPDEQGAVRAIGAALVATPESSRQCYGFSPDAAPIPQVMMDEVMASESAGKLHEALLAEHRAAVACAEHLEHADGSECGCSQEDDDHNDCEGMWHYCGKMQALRAAHAEAVAAVERLKPT